MDPSFLYLMAAGWGVLWGAMTSIPMGPTGALVVARAHRGDRLGIYWVTAGFALAHLCYQGLYFWLFSSAVALQTNAGPAATVSDSAWFRWMAPTGALLLAMVGLRYLWNAGQSIVRGTSAPKVARSKPMQLKIQGRYAPQVVPATFIQSFVLAILNPVLLIFLAANASLFGAQMGGSVANPLLAVLFLSTLLGTSAWYIGFGEWLRRSSRAWTPRSRALADGLSGLLMLAAGLSLGARVWG
jgi:threonine/homoserine/homoserine lactone efflux protein